MRPLTRQDINRHINQTYISRGDSYYIQGRVHELEVLRGGTQITSSVAGSNRKTYQVIVNLNYHPESTTLVQIRGHCSCPVGYNCKHVAATLLAHEKQIRLSNENDAPPDLDPILRYWLNTIQHSAKSTTASPESTHQFELHYVLSLTHDNRLGNPLLQIANYKTRRLKSRNSWSKGTQLTQVSQSQSTFLTAQDKELARLLEANSAEFGYRRHQNAILQGDVAPYLLERLIRSGRAHWESLEGAILNLGQPQPGQINWQLEQQQAKITITEPAGLTLLPVAPPWYLDPQTWQAGPLQTELPANIAATLIQAPPIPVRQCEQVAKVLQQHFPNKSLPLPKAKIKLTGKDIKPQPCLSLVTRENLTMPFYDYEDNWDDYAELSFQYGDTQVNPADPETILLQQTGNHFEQIKRRPTLERKHKKILVQSGLKKVTTRRGTYNSINSTRYQHPEAEAGWLDFVSNTTPALRQQGWKITFAPGFRYNLVEADDWYADLDEGSGENWFNLELGVTIEGKSFNLLRILVDFIQNERHANTLNEWLDHPADTELRLPLADGRLLRVPFGKVRHIIETLVELYDPNALNKDGQLTISRYQAAQLQALDEVKLIWGGLEGPRRLAKQLANFDCINTIQPPDSLRAELRPYQQYGLNWLQFLREYGLSGILADDMGLGKTVQALAHLLVEKQAGRTKHPSLVVAPTSLMMNWAREAAKFAPDLRIVTLQGSDRQQHFSHLPEYDLVLSTYPLLPRDSDVLLQQHWHLLILDEAQNIKNPRSKVAYTARRLQAEYRLCLTGTPIENHLGELWSQFHFLMPGLLGDEKHFRQLFRKPIENQGDELRQKQLQQRVAPFILRREKTQVVQELPEKTEIITDVELSGGQQQLYETVRIAMHDKIRKAIDKKGIERSQIIILDALLKLRQICCDPRLLKLDTAAKVKESAKLQRLMELLPEMISEGRRVLLFSQFTSMLALIEKALAEHTIDYVKLTGQTRDRATPIDRFQNGEVPLFLISLKAGGAGLNLTAADTVIHYDPWWNPAVERQATDRAHRIGQKNKVFVYKLITQGTVEEKINNLQQKKQALADALFDGEQNKAALTRDDLYNLFAPLGHDT
ncbi:MAG: DEAD/DEAH box helicase [Pseudomonadota bacterium]